MEPRDYQDAARRVGCWEWIAANDGNPCIVLPTGAGKTLLLALICMDAVNQWSGRVLVLSHVKELVQGAAQAIRKLCPEITVGVNSAGLNRRDTQGDVVVAGIQSIHRDVTKLGAFDLVIVDEAHLIPPSGDGMYRTALHDLKAMARHVRLIGLTATPYRTSSGYLCGPSELLTDISYEVGIPELINRGFLSPIVNRQGINTDTSSLHMRGGEFIEKEAIGLMADVVEPACRNIIENTEDRRSVLVFTQSIQHCEDAAERIRSAGQSVATVHSDITHLERNEALRRFESGDVKYLVNVDVLTTGYNNPRIDAISLLRCTASPGLYYQMVGRGFRTAEGKDDCLILDYGGNIKRHGPVDEIEPRKPRTAGGDAPTKTCVACDVEINAGARRCPFCGEEQPASEPKAPHDIKPDSSSLVVAGVGNGIEKHEVERVQYCEHYKRGFFKGDPDCPPPTLRVDYYVGGRFPISEWVCLEHEGYAGRKAANWWKKRCSVEPESVADAVKIAERGQVAEPQEIYTKQEGKYKRVQRVILGPIPEVEDEHLMDWLIHHDDADEELSCHKCGSKDVSFSDDEARCFSCDELVRVF